MAMDKDKLKDIIATLKALDPRACCGSPSSRKLRENAKDLAAELQKVLDQCAINDPDI